MSRSIAVVLTLLAFWAIMTSAYGVSHSLEELKEPEWYLTNGTELTIIDSSKYDHMWVAKYPDGTIYESGVGKEFKLVVPPKDAYDQLIISLTLATASGCIATYEGYVNLVPEETKEVEIPRTKIVWDNITESRTVNQLMCGIYGSSVIGPKNTSETYKYTGGSSGKLAYNWTLEGDVVANGKDVTSVGDLKLDWSTDAKAAPFDGIAKEIGINIASKTAIEDGEPVTQTTECSKTVMVYPPLFFGIVGPDSICSNDTVKDFTYTGNFSNTLTFVWSIDGNVVGDNSENVTIDFSNSDIVAGYGDHKIALDVTRTTPEGLLIEGSMTKIVKYEENPVLPGMKSI